MRKAIILIGQAANKVVYSRRVHALSKVYPSFKQGEAKVRSQRDLLKEEKSWLLGDSFTEGVTAACKRVKRVKEHMNNENPYPRGGKRSRFFDGQPFRRAQNRGGNNSARGQRQTYRSGRGGPTRGRGSWHYNRQGKDTTVPSSACHNKSIRSLPRTLPRSIPKSSPPNVKKPPFRSSQTRGAPQPRGATSGLRKKTGR